jgi:hypothetical protein
MADPKYMNIFFLMSDSEHFFCTKGEKIKTNQREGQD